MVRLSPACIEFCYPGMEVLKRKFGWAWMSLMAWRHFSFPNVLSSSLVESWTPPETCAHFRGCKRPFRSAPMPQVCISLTCLHFANHLPKPPMFRKTFLWVMLAMWGKSHAQKKGQRPCGNHPLQEFPSAVQNRAHRQSVVTVPSRCVSNMSNREVAIHMLKETAKSIMGNLTLVLQLSMNMIEVQSPDATEEEQMPHLTSQLHTMCQEMMRQRMLLQHVAESQSKMKTANVIPLVAVSSPTTGPGVPLPIKTGLARRTSLWTTPSQWCHLWSPTRWCRRWPVRRSTPSCEEFRTTLEVLLIREQCQDHAVFRWIPTTTMLADALTKPMDPTLLREALKRGVFCLFDEAAVLRQNANCRPTRNPRSIILLGEHCDNSSRGVWIWQSWTLHCTKAEPIASVGVPGSSRERWADPIPVRTVKRTP